MTELQVKAIETEYSGYRFRSRLEARWAVFFNRLGIEWVYEPEGYTFGGHQYLPDFWLPSLRIWVEVKGVLTAADAETIYAAVLPTGLPSAPNGRPLSSPDRPNWHHRMLLLGAIPEPGHLPTHTRLDTFCGQVLAHDVSFAKSDEWWLYPVGEPHNIGWMAKADLITEEHALEWRADLLNNPWLRLLTPTPDLEAAYKAARTARFEHGERG